jgi:hypothetical protein
VAISDLSKAMNELPVSSLLKSIGLLAHTGALGFYNKKAEKKPARIFNRVVAELVSKGAPYRYIALPGIGSGMSLNELQLMALDVYNNGATTLEDISSGVGARLKRFKRTFITDGQPIDSTNIKEVNRDLSVRLEPFVKTTLPLLKTIGGVE